MSLRDRALSKLQRRSNQAELHSPITPTKSNPMIRSGDSAAMRELEAMFMRKLNQERMKHDDDDK
jgi:hypothetical protein